MNDSGFKTFQASAALAIFRRVRLDNDGKLAYCSDSSTDCIGVTMEAATAADQYIAVALSTKQGTHTVTASEAILITSTLYAAANGKVATSGTVLVGEPLQTASGDGVSFEAALSPAAILGNIARSALTEDALAAFDVMDAMRGADGAALAASETAGDFFRNVGTNQDLIDGEATANETEASVGWMTFTLPECYVAGGDITIRAAAGVVQSGAAPSAATIDFSAYKQATDGTVGSDLVSTAATAITSTIGNKDFTVTPTGLVAGDKLNIKMTTSVTQGAADTSSARITRLQILCDIKG